MKKFLKIAAILLVIFVIAVVGLVYYGFTQINSLAKVAVEKGGTFATGVATKVDSVDVGLFSGKLGLKGLNIANPPGYTGAQFLALGDAKVEVNANTISTSVIELPLLWLSDINISLEKTGDKANYQIIIDNLAKLTSGQPKPPADPNAPAKDKKFIVNDLTIRNVKVHAELVGSGGALGDVLNKATAVNITIPEIKLANVGKTGTGVGGTGVTGSELTSIILQAVLSAAANSGGLSPEMLGDLKGSLAKLGDLSKFADVKQLGEVASKISEAAAKGDIKGAVDQGKKVVDDVTKGIEGLIPGKKPQEPKK